MNNNSDSKEKIRIETLRKDKKNAKKLNSLVNSTESSNLPENTKIESVVREHYSTIERDYLISSIIGDYLRYLRNNKKLTLSEVANRSNFSAQAISLCERAKRMPSPNMLLTLSKIYDCSEDELLNLRTETIIVSVEKYGSDAPISVLNEYEVIMNARENQYQLSVTDPSFVRASRGSGYVAEKKTPREYLDLGSEPASEEELQLAKAYLLALRSINKK